MTHIGHSEKVSSMRVLIAILVLILSLQSWTKADDIRDLQIEGISIGDSLLNHFSKQKILNPLSFYEYEQSDKFYHIAFNSTGNYDQITITLKKNDTSYKIHTIGGDIIDIKIEDCHRKKREIDSELTQLFGSNAERIDSGSFRFTGDKTGKSLFYTIRYMFNSGDLVVLQCKDYSKEVGLKDALLLDISTKEFRDWLHYEVHKGK